MENELHKQLLIDGVKLSILDKFLAHVQGTNDIDTLKQIKKELDGE